MLRLQEILKRLVESGRSQQRWADDGRHDMVRLTDEAIRDQMLEVEREVARFLVQVAIEARKL